MKYLGKGSLSSVISTVLHIAWWVVLIGSIIGFVFMFVMMFVIDFNDSDVIAKMKECFEPEDLNDPEWQEFQNMPLAAKIFILPYFAFVVTMLLLVICKAQQLFTHLKQDIVFDERNILLLSKISKYLIIFSIATFDLATLLASLLLLIVNQILKRGTSLQKDQDLTI